MGSWKFWAAPLVAVVGVLGVATPPAGASTGELTLAGSSTNSPGITATGSTPQTWTFGATGLLVTATAHATVSCAFAGNDSIGSVAQSAGSFSGNCSWAGGSASVAGSYVRTGAVSTVSATMSGSESGALNGTCTDGSANTRPGSFGDECQFTIT